MSIQYDKNLSVFDLSQEDREKVLAHAEYLVKNGYVKTDIVELANFLVSKEAKKENKPDFLEFLLEKVNSKEEEIE